MWIFIGSWASVRSSITVKTCFQCVQKLHHHPIYIIMVSDTLYNKHFILFLFISGWDLIDLIYFVSAAVLFLHFAIHWFTRSRSGSSFVGFYMSLVLIISLFEYIRHTKWPNERRRLATEIKWQNFAWNTQTHKQWKVQKSSYKHMSRI